MFSLPFDYKSEKSCKVKETSATTLPRIECFTNTAAVVFPSFFLFFLSFFRVAASVQTGLALPLIVPPIRESFETKPTLPLQPMKVRAQRLLFVFLLPLFALEHTYANTVASCFSFFHFRWPKPYLAKSNFDKPHKKHLI